MTDTVTPCPTCGGAGGWPNVLAEDHDYRITRGWADCNDCGGSGQAGEWVLYSSGRGFGKTQRATMLVSAMIRGGRLQLCGIFKESVFGTL